MTEPDLQVMPADWQRALVVVAHPDDIEYGGSAAVARWREAGKEVAYLLASRGEAGIDDLPPEQSGPIREAEQVAAAEVVGVSAVDFLDHPDGMITYGLPLRRDIAAAIRRYRPELIVIGNHHDTWPGGYLNMADHREVGRATLDAIRDAANRWVFRDLLEQDLQPWGGPRWVAVAGSPWPTHAVEVSGTIEKGVASLREHRAYLAALDGPMAEADTTLREFARSAGERFGGGLACAFELIAV